MLDLPVGISEFSELRKKNRLYVDKTEYAYILLTKESRTFLSRPRRFGKSLFVSTLAEILKGNKDLFQGLWIEKSDYDWKPVGVILLDFSELNIQSKEKFIDSLTDVLIEIGEINEIYIEKGLDITAVFRRLVSGLFNKFGSVAVLIDEYDYPILHTLHKPSLAKELREVTQNFSSIIKARQRYIHFVFVTGVSAFTKSGLSAGLNNLKNLTMDPKFSGICGYTEEEFDLYFSPYMKNWSESEEIPYDTLRSEVNSWYYGYRFEESASPVYSPFSLTCAVDLRKLQNFWFESATSRFLLDELSKAERQKECNFLQLDQLQGSWDLLQTFEIESIPLPALLFQMGYLTIDRYDPALRIYTLKYPNLEVKTSLHRHLLIVLTKASPSYIDSLVSNLVSALHQENIEGILENLTNVFSRASSELHQKEEKFYHALLEAIFIAAGVKVQPDFCYSHGWVDLVLELYRLLYIIDVKFNQSAEEALKQLETCRYYESFLHLGKSIRLLGLSFTKKKSESEEEDLVITGATKK